MQEESIERSIQSRVPFGTFRLKFLDLSSLPMSSSMAPIEDWMLYTRRDWKGQAGAVMRTNLLRTIVCRGMFWRSAGQAKWGRKSRMSKKVTQQRTGKRVSAKESWGAQSSLGNLARAPQGSIIGSRHCTQE